MISLSHGFLFIHIPKTAGNAIQNVLKQYSEERVVTIAPHQDGVERFEVRAQDYEIRKHSGLAEYQSTLGKSVTDQLFKFTCVRNPWERAISFFFSPHRGPVEWNRSDFISLLGEIEPMKAFVNELGDSPDHTNFGTMDFYMRFARLQEDFEQACRMTGINPEPLARRNVSSRCDYRDYYDDELIELVGRRYVDEIRHFGFQFGDR